MLQGTCIRETRTAAREIKFLVTLEQASRVLDWARTRLDPDPYAGGETGDEYRTTTIYFDTDRFDVYHRQGSYGRSKHRVRQYGDSDSVFLERKLRTPDLLSKRRAVIARHQLDQVLASQVDVSWCGYWFSRRIKTRALAPVCQVTYLRHARVAAGPHGPMRLTFDNHILAQPSTALEIAPVSGLPVLETHAIMEMKYCREIPTIFKHLVEEFGLSPSPISKYRLSLEALKRAGTRTGPGLIDLAGALQPSDTGAAPGLVNA